MCGFDVFSQGDPHSWKKYTPLTSQDWKNNQTMCATPGGANDWLTSCITVCEAATNAAWVPLQSLLHPVATPAPEKGLSWAIFIYFASKIAGIADLVKKSNDEGSLSKVPGRGFGLHGDQWQLHDCQPEDDWCDVSDCPTCRGSNNDETYLIGLRTGCSAPESYIWRVERRLVLQNQHETTFCIRQ